MKNKEQIRQKIKEGRGKYGRERRKRWLYYKHIGRIDLYYKQKIPKIEKGAQPATDIKNVVGNLKWWQRIYIFLKLGFKRLWRKIFQSKI